MLLGGLFSLPKLNILAGVNISLLLHTFSFGLEVISPLRLQFPAFFKTSLLRGAEAYFRPLDTFLGAPYASRSISEAWPMGLLDAQGGLGDAPGLILVSYGRFVANRYFYVVKCSFSDPPARHLSATSISLDSKICHPGNPAR